MPTKIPSKQFGFFKNYYNHLNYHVDEMGKKIKLHKFDINAPVIMAKSLGGVMVERLSRSQLSVAFDDKYDVTDELLGSVLTSPIMTPLSIISILMSAYELTFMMAIKAGFVRDDKEDHTKKAASYLIAGLALATFSYIYTLKCMISLVTRTFCTITDGWKDSTEQRFSDKCTMKEPISTTMYNQIFEESTERYFSS